MIRASRLTLLAAVGLSFAACSSLPDLPKMGGAPSAAVAPAQPAGPILAQLKPGQWAHELSDLADIDFHTARKILERREIDGLAVVCRAANFDRALFLTFALLILDPSDDAMSKAKTYGELYAALPREAALRTIRFWRLRRQTGDVAAA